MKRLAAVTAAIATGAALVFAAVAPAKTIELVAYTGDTYTGAGSTGGAFDSGIVDVGVHQATGHILVLTSTGITQLDSSGAPVNFAATGTSTIAGSFTGEVAALAVDNTAGATNGNFYAAAESGPIRAFKADGTELGGNFPLGGHSTNCGHAVDPQGDLWVANYSGNNLTEYNSAGAPTGASFPTPTPCRVTIDAAGNFYVSQYTSPLRKYDPSGTELYALDNESARGVGVNPATGEVFVNHTNNVAIYSSVGNPITTTGEAEGSYEGLVGSYGVAVDSDTGRIYATNRRGGHVGLDVFAPTGPIVVPDVTTEAPTVEPTSAVLRATINPDGIDTTECFFQWGKTTNYGNTVPCDQGQVHSGTADIAVTAELTGLKQGDTYNYRIVAANENVVQSVGANRPFKPQGPPIVIDPYVSEVNTDGARLNASIEPNGGTTDYHFEWGEEDCSSGPEACVSLPTQTLASNVGVQAISAPVAGLTPGSEYHFRVVAENDNGEAIGDDNVFRTFPNASKDPDDCANAHVRQQTGARLLLDCRAYELVSAADTGGYDVLSNLTPGQEPPVARPMADDRMLYSLHFGTIPGIAGNPTNFGVDPYVATRGESGWSTRYVGIPVNGTPDDASFASDLSDSSADLGAFAFGGPDLCDPCFPGGTGIPIRDAAGNLIQGMAGSLPGAPIPAGFVAKHFSADGSHFVFGSESQFEPEGNAGSVTIYDRNLATGQTQVVSTDDDGETITEEVGQLDISADGSRIVIGEYVDTDAAGNDYWHPYMHVGTSTDSIDLAPGSTSGVKFAGMSADGSAVYYVSFDQLTGDDNDSGADLYRATVSGSSADVALVSIGSGGGDSDACDPVPGAGSPHWNVVGATADCSVAAFAGGAGVASGDGTVYLLSPEALDGEGEADMPNLFVVRPGGEPVFVATLEPTAQAIRNAVRASAEHSFADFQVSSDGRFAAFSSTESLTGFVNLGFDEVFRYDASAGELDCASCATTGAAPSSAATLSSYGLNLTDDGSVFFTSAEALVLRDTNNRMDAYQWEAGEIQVVSTGSSLTDSGFFSVDPDGVNAFFFTREVLVPQDRNGTTMKIYVAREDGGYPTLPVPVPCQASDECHGPSSAQPGPPLIGTLTGEGGQYRAEPAPQRCRKGQVKRKGKCVAKKCKRNQVKRKGKCVKRGAKKGKRAAKRRNGRAKNGRGRSA